jgi:hypothetical protein
MVDVDWHHCGGQRRPTLTTPRKNAGWRTAAAWIPPGRGSDGDRLPLGVMTMRGGRTNSLRKQGDQRTGGGVMEQLSAHYVASLAHRCGRRTWVASSPLARSAPRIAFRRERTSPHAELPSALRRLSDRERRVVAFPPWPSPTGCARHHGAERAVARRSGRSPGRGAGSSCGVHSNLGLSGVGSTCTSLAPHPASRRDQNDRNCSMVSES